MRKFLKALVIVPLAAVMFVFAIANRQTVIFSLDPFGTGQPSDPLVFAVPLFILAIALVIAGVLVGGFVTWLRQGKWRRLAREREVELRTLRAENEKLKHEIETAVPALALPATRPIFTPSD